ncbi:MAG: indolepyruvate/phenylpyruvate decarboxylase [Gammaproteobacteria bacterium]|nr:indolepyruvate/phenylpyruvate decarboxylase [Gammaproteobacteria bacterium]
MNLAESLLLGLKNYGVEEIFGIPGDFALPLFKVMEESEILPLYTFSHEPAVGFAADAAARFHSKPSVAAVTYGAGAFNMVNPVAAAYAEKSPVIVLSGGPGEADRSTGLLVHHQAKQLSSQMQMFKEVTCDQVILDDPKTAPDLIARVLRNCILESRPVYIEVPRDKVFDNCAEVPGPVEADIADADALAACADEIITRLASAKSPVMMVGVEIRRYGLEDAVRELCQKLNVPVVTTFMGRGLLAGQEVPLQGTYMGKAGDARITQMVENSDALILLGVLLSDTNFGISEKKIDLRKTILASDGRVSLGYHSYLDMPITSLVKTLNQKLETKKPQAAVELDYPASLSADEQAITPTDIARAVNDMFEDHERMPIAADMGDCLFTALDIEHTELVAPGYYATMGFGVPAGLGVQAATGRRPIIMVGDGAFQMTGWELLNCKRYGWNPVVLLLNNSSWEMLRAFQPESKFNDLDHINYANIADSLGGVGRRANTRLELRDALNASVADESSFQLVEIMLKRGELSQTLSRFVEGIKGMRAQS